MIELYNSSEVSLFAEDTVIYDMYSCYSIYPGVESGGVLIGKKECAMERFIISRVGMPSRKDIQKKYEFIRNKSNAHKLVQKAWKKSAGFENHLGEWHSHVFPDPRPSEQDIDEMKRAYLDGEYVFRYFFTIICSVDSRMFIGVARDGKIKFSRIINFEGALCTDTL